jgi:hypothetical protein
VIIRKEMIPIGDFRFTIRIVTERQAEPEVPARLGELRRFKYAFISYAHKDRAEVLKRVQMLSFMRAAFFQDFISLRPGERWRPAILEALDKSDVVLLFWSRAASESEEVRKEILYALERRRGNEDAPPAIEPIIIEGPPPADPPAELAFLQFDDIHAYWISAVEGAVESERPVNDPSAS